MNFDTNFIGLLYELFLSLSKVKSLLNEEGILYNSDLLTPPSSINDFSSVKFDSYLCHNPNSSLFQMIKGSSSLSKL